MTTATRPPVTKVAHDCSNTQRRGCHCEKCLAARRLYDTTRTRLVAYGRWQPYVNPEPARSHALFLISRGFETPHIAQAANLRHGTITNLVSGNTSRGRGPSKGIRATTEQAILAIPANLDIITGAVEIDGTGTRRRLQALVACGWPQARLAAAVGKDKRNFFRTIRSDRVYADTARAVRRLYDQLWNVDPASRGVHPRYINQALAIAKANKWARPAAWDDDSIDDPTATPDYGRKTPRTTALAEDGLEIEAQGHSRQEAAERLHVTKDCLSQAIKRYREALDAEAGADDEEAAA
ncbi:hypothetical protein QMK19_03280 [Streptomyces sp. H10-C2]|uniref:hypothetical protein n=1 Tax=unclassified Streptomyces TaxID=2593676 RepID=UPI0024B88B84|nr:MULTISPECIES: hypothetical protein [unclassified Streptomyces]MDJ0342208.1 hypothetical protein [Streptomyces sp. PH10-H1]MDJ0368722.1 hypothetical protein [Streptomyces sp. H10-C2]